MSEPAPVPEGTPVPKATAEHRAAFRRPLLDWFERFRRPMPWREPGPDGRRDPYRVWVSEIMLQQTRVDQAQPYFERFMAHFPTVEALAEASVDDVLVQWEGLGYYSRARNLHRAAQSVVADYGGRVPDTEPAIRSLPGVGPYTAAAVLSLAYDVPLAVLDGNVTRVLTRVFAVDALVSRAPVKRGLQNLAQDLLPPDRPGTFNEAVMELGATVCTPRAPACPRCPLNAVCAAYAAGVPEAYPVTPKKKPVPHLDIAIGIVEDGDGRVLIQRRAEDAMLGGLWEFPGGKIEPNESPSEACAREVREEVGLEVEVGEPVARVDHTYSHLKVTLHAFACRVQRGEAEGLQGQPLRWIEADALDEVAMPRANRKVLEALKRREAAPTLFGGAASA